MGVFFLGGYRALISALVSVEFEFLERKRETERQRERQRDTDGDRDRPRERDRERVTFKLSHRFHQREEGKSDLPIF